MTVGGSTSPTELRAQLALAIPLAAQQMGLMLMGLVDTAVLGHYHRDALAGGGVANSLVFGVTCVGLGIAMGLETLLPQALGAGRRADTRWLLADGMRVAVAVGLLLSLVVAASPLILPVVGVQPAVARQAELYVWTRSFGVVLFLVQVTLRVFLQAHGVTRPLIVAVVIGNAVNVLLDWVLVFGDRGLADLGLPTIGLPALGVVGAALATIAVQLVIVAIYAAAARTLLGGIPRGPRPPSAVRRILVLGVPVGLQLGAEVGAFALAALLAARIGELPAAGHQVAINLASFTFSMALGIGAAVAVRVGHAVGAGDHRLARARGGTALRMGLAVMSAGAALFLLVPAELAGLFTDDPEVIAAAVPMLRVAAIFQLSDGAQAIAAGALRGAGDTRATFIANLIGHYAVGLAVSLTCAFWLEMGAVGLWWGLSAGLTATAIGLLVRFRRLTARTIAPA
jgi:multidrug resistance protein, MATE family